MIYYLRGARFGFSMARAEPAILRRLGLPLLPMAGNPRPLTTPRYYLTYRCEMYITIEELITRFGKSEIVQCNDPSATGMVDEAMLNNHINQAQAEIDFYLSQRYQTPIIFSNNNVKGGATSLLGDEDGAHHLAKSPLNNPPASANNSDSVSSLSFNIMTKIAGELTRARYFEGVATIPEEVARAASDARNTLKQIANGKLNIAGVAISNADTSKDNHVGFGGGQQGQLSQNYRGHY